MSDEKKTVSIEIDPEEFAQAFRESIKEMNGMAAEAHDAQALAESGCEASYSERVKAKLMNMLDSIECEMARVAKPKDVNKLAHAACGIVNTMKACKLLNG